MGQKWGERAFHHEKEQIKKLTLYWLVIIIGYNIQYTQQYSPLLTVSKCRGGNSKLQSPGGQTGVNAGCPRPCQ